MPTTTPSGWTRLPTIDDLPNVPADMLKMAVDLEARISPHNRARNDPVELEQSKAGTQSIPNAAWTKITVGTVLYDARAGSGDLGSSSSGIVINTAGRYWVEGSLAWESTTGTGRRGLGLGPTTGTGPHQKTQQMEWFNTGALHYMKTGATISCAVGEIITLWAYQQGGTTTDALQFQYSVRRLRVSDLP